ncbi:2-amino-4-hydroxy-6-hydroxymethyldihydropteridine diphosphokinase [Nocardia caishijiensis]|uniref:2-amino-4-hydroxy-6-hydroxymethyldihydropteridine diphosphokinase n=1 Tax=Nocardia caishijiensis TaxID=184756 RepID=A0ABQ6YEW8_9NOCA|nr:2-amino-4-hydroxy-6-hydroxymethyldihydropteridine diphosphokinase [Nocardia caishijiensis]KAF0836543.1 2-amino-4-hydroxy-6-hydroxymethyldihydropteridine diphosphokinase [Nocardia caishijiensis]
MTRVVLSIGANLGDRLAHLRGVLDALGERTRAVSPVYTTAPWGGVDQDDYLNAVVVAEDPTFDGYDWLRFGQRLEQAAGRVRAVRWGARTLDVDIVQCVDGGEAVVRDTDPTLILPHPEAYHRAFVLVPWHDVEPDARLRVDGAEVPIGELLHAVDPAERAGVVRTDLVLGESARPC